MTAPSLDPSRRGVLAAAVTAAATVGLTAGAMPATAAVAGVVTEGPAAPATLAELEARALALAPPVFLLETAVPEQFSTSDGTALRIVPGIARVGGHSLRWDHRPGSRLQVRQPIHYSGGDDTLALWLHRAEPSTGTLRLELGRGAGTDAWCEIHLDFTGWRTAWIRLAHDLEGTPHRGMNTLRLVAPQAAGTLHLDQLILNTPIRDDWPTPDRQVPFVNTDVATQDNRHWLSLLRFAGLAAAPLPTPAPTEAELAGLDAVKSAYTAAVRKQVTVTTDLVDTIAASVDDLGVPPTDTTGGGRPVNGYQDSIYPVAIAADLKRLAPTAPLRAYGDLMFKVASAYDSTSDPALRARLGDLYVRLLAHLADQGWADGSSQGTIHHLGYQARGLYSSVWLMRSLLQERHLLGRTRASMAWLQGLGRLRDDWSDAMPYGGIFDILNTTLLGMIGTVLLADGAAEKVAGLRLVQAWLDHALAHSPGIEDGFKPDLSTFHHVGHYPDYARDGFKGASPALAALSGTAFAVSPAAHRLWQEALLRMRFYANRTQWPLGLSARHPTGLTGLSVDPYQVMTTAGSPDGSSDLDRELGAAFMRLAPAKPTTAQKVVIQALKRAGVAAEPSPTGCVVMNHAAAVLHRRDDWLVAVRGHNRYLWSTEIYPANNEFGRYVGYGQVQVMTGGDPVTNKDSGYVQPGWDWNRWPGTTAITVPFDLLRADLSASGEEMLLTDSRIGGGGTLEGRNGVFLIDLHEHPKYDESHRARKSVFLFDDRVVALGSGITNRDGEHRTETTLFQVHLPGPAPAQHDSTLGTIAAVPYRADRELTSAAWHVDPQGIGYYVPGGQRLVVTRAVQTCPDQGATTEAAEPFATAWLDHGPAPAGATYEYAMVVGATAADMAGFAAAMDGGTDAPYAVLRRDDLAHVVRDRATGITGYAVFAPVDGLTGGPVERLDTASVVLTRPDGDGLLLSVTDPDLHLYEGLDPDQYDARGRFVGDVTPYSRPWRRSPGRASEVALRLTGRWSADAQGVTVTSGASTTEVVVRCSAGVPTELRLAPA